MRLDILQVRHINDIMKAVSQERRARRLPLCLLSTFQQALVPKGNKRGEEILNERGEKDREEKSLDPFSCNGADKAFHKQGE